MTVHEGTKRVFNQIADKYKLPNPAQIIRNDDHIVWKKDVTICITNILKAVEAEGATQELLKEAKNMYNGPIFAINAQEGKYLIKADPDPKKAVEELGKFDFCFKLSPYHVINTYLAILVAQITAQDLNALLKKGEEHMEAFIAAALRDNPNWKKDSLTSDKPLLIIPIGAAGCGKSTFYQELGNVVNASCDNIRYMLFKDFGPCFAPWESTLAWFVVNRLTDVYLSRGYNVFYNGVNTDLEYRSPITMENPDPLYAGIPYNMKLVYFEPTVSLTADEVSQLKGINLWANPLDKVDRSGLSQNVCKILDLIQRNTERTMERTKAIREGKAEQDPFDILYPVPPAIVKMFMEQSFSKPEGPKVVVVPRKEIPDAAERAAFYREYAEKALKQ
ncbi:MAG: ATP-binding protein [Candidatus Riflebacteria bacterium]|nr:ATP-binding protein [Candidatus Riflebacteria bacterium]